MTVAGDFKEIRATVDLEAKSWENLRNLPSFYIFNHRGKALSPDYDPPVPKQKYNDPDPYSSSLQEQLQLGLS